MVKMNLRYGKTGVLHKEQALNLRYGEHIYDKQGNQYKVNGKPRLINGELRVPIKYGLYQYGYITPSNMNEFLSPYSVSYGEITLKKHQRQMNKNRQIRYAGKIFKVK
jgi:hypothetical protein